MQRVTSFPAMSNAPIDLLSQSSRMSAAIRRDGPPVLLRVARAVLPCCTLVACAVGPDYKPASPGELAIPDRFNYSSDASAGETDLARWWRSFDDDQLNWLVETALAANLDVTAAGSRLRQARALVRVARADLVPTLDASGSAARNWRRNEASPATAGSAQYSAGIDAAYEVDLFGGFHRSVEAARADAQSADADVRDAQRTIVAEVGLDYLDLRSAQTRLQIARDSLAAQDQVLQIVGWRVQAGLASSLDLAQASALRAQTAATIPALETSVATSVDALAVLLGVTSGTLAARVAAPGPIPGASSDLAADVPVKVIARRPDVRAAERSFAAETARIGVEQARLYPALLLSGSLSGSAGSIGNLTDFAAGSLVAALTAPIFHGGALRARIEQQSAAAAVAWDTYRLVVLRALQDVDDALASVAGANRRERELLTAATASAEAVMLARMQYQSGLIDFVNLLDAERTSLASQDALATARADRSRGLVRLYKALGGGWQGAPLPGSAAPGAEARPDLVLASKPGAR